MNRARFWRRYAAYSADTVVVALLGLPLLLTPLRGFINGFQVALEALQHRMLEALMTQDVTQPFALLGIAQDPALIRTFREVIAAPTQALLCMLLIIIGLSLPYHVGFESGRWQATPGKRWLGLQVRTQGTSRITWIHSLLRFFAGATSWLTLNIGHAMVAWRADRLALHDAITRSEVISLQGDVPLPASARLWLWVQFIALMLPVLWWVLAMLRGLAAIATI